MLTSCVNIPLSSSPYRLFRFVHKHRFYGLTGDLADFGVTGSGLVSGDGLSVTSMGLAG